MRQIKKKKKTFLMMILRKMMKMEIIFRTIVHHITMQIIKVKKMALMVSNLMKELRKNVKRKNKRRKIKRRNEEKRKLL